MQMREPLTKPELLRAMKQATAAMTGSEENSISDDEFRAYGYGPGFMDVVAELTVSLVEGLPDGIRKLLEVEVGAACIAMACVVGQALNNREELDSKSE